MDVFLGCSIFWEKAQAKNALGPNENHNKKSMRQSAVNIFVFLKSLISVLSNPQTTILAIIGS